MRLATACVIAKMDNFSDEITVREAVLNMEKQTGRWFGTGEVEKEMSELENEASQYQGDEPISLILKEIR